MRTLSVAFVLLFAITFATAGRVSLQRRLLQSAYDVSVDGNSNENWIQVLIEPAGATSAQLTYNGNTYSLTQTSWSNIVFTGKPSSAIPAGSTVTVTATFADGQQQASIPWNFSGAPKYTGGPAPASGSTPSSPSSSPSTPTTSTPSAPLGNPPAGVSMTYINNQVASFNRQFGAAPQAYVGGVITLLQQWKTALNNAISANGVNNAKTRSLIQALFGAESQTMYDASGNAQRDTSKDGTSAMNYSPLNMNQAMLKKIKFNGNPAMLNSASNINLTVATLLTAIQKLGLNGFMNFQRGGGSAYANPSKYQAKYKIPQYLNGIYNMMVQFQKDPTLWTDGRKVWANIPHV